MKKKSFRLSDAVPNAKRDVDDELAFHLEMRAREYMEQGMPEDEARRRAAHSFGDAAVAFVASYVPAVRATRVAPTEALRYD